MSDSLNFFNALRPKILELITRETADCLRLSPYVVAVAPDSSTGLIGVSRVGDSNANNGKRKEILSSSEERGDPLGGVVPLISFANANPIIYVKYHSSLSTASVGDSVLLVYRGNLCNAYALPSF